MDQEARDALAAYDLGAPSPSLTPIVIGLINRTFLVEAGDARFVLQRVNPIFGPDVHLDIDAVTAHLERAGLATPRLARTRSGALFTRDGEGAVWRILTYVRGRTVDVVGSPATARAAGALVGRFHRALATLDHRFRFSRPGAHDTAAHLAALAAALDEHRGHPAYDRVAPVGERILALAGTRPALPAGPLRIAHGDLKITNVLLDDTLARGIALVDLDTLGRLPIAVELGDALRSWCNPRGEDEPASGFDAGLALAAIDGYAEATGELLTAPERETIVAGAETLALELAARFCADALRERYFGWDPRRFPSRSEHGRVRALSQLAVAESVAAQRGALEAGVRAAFRR